MRDHVLLLEHSVHFVRRGHRTDLHYGMPPKSDTHAGAILPNSTGETPHARDYASIFHWVQAQAKASGRHRATPGAGHAQHIAKPLPRPQ